jgi:hypothetical protein
MDDVSLFADLSFFLTTMNLYYIDVIYSFEWMNIVYFVKRKKKTLQRLSLIWVPQNLRGYPVYTKEVLYLFLSSSIVAKNYTLKIDK